MFNMSPLWALQWWEWWGSVHVQLTHRDKACKCLEHLVVTVPDVSPAYISFGMCVCVDVYASAGFLLQSYWLGVKQGVLNHSQVLWHVLLTIRLREFSCCSYFGVGNWDHDKDLEDYLKILANSFAIVLWSELKKRKNKLFLLLWHFGRSFVV